VSVDEVVSFIALLAVRKNGPTWAYQIFALQVKRRHRELESRLATSPPIATILAFHRRFDMANRIIATSRFLFQFAMLFGERLCPEELPMMTHGPILGRPSAISMTVLGTDFQTERLFGSLRHRLGKP